MLTDSARTDGQGQRGALAAQILLCPATGRCHLSPGLHTYVLRPYLQLHQPNSQLAMAGVEGVELIEH